MTALLHWDDFAACLNNRFAVQKEDLDDDGPVAELELIEVSEVRRGGPYEAFSLLFRGPADRPLEQCTYHVRHHKLGDTDIFLAPVGRDGSGLLYEAVFNRLAVP